MLDIRLGAPGHRIEGVKCFYDVIGGGFAGGGIGEDRIGRVAP